jgi:hypothetical protein
MVTFGIRNLAEVENVHAMHFAGCNVYVFCKMQDGCLHDGVTEPFQQCVLKYNGNLNTWSLPPAYSRGDGTNFTSGTSPAPASTLNRGPKTVPQPN